jgi:hypothetical protein
VISHDDSSYLSLWSELRLIRQISAARLLFVVERELFSRSFVSSRQLYLLLIAQRYFLFTFGSEAGAGGKNSARHRAGMPSRHFV